MNCPCIPCNNQYQGLAPVLTVENTRAAEIPLDVWGLIFKSLDLPNKLACSMTCKRWRYVITRNFRLFPHYYIGTYVCFKTFYADFLKSRHIIIVERSLAMQCRVRRENRVAIINKLMNFLDPIIKARGIHVGNWNNELNIKYIRKKEYINNFFSEIYNTCVGKDFDSLALGIFDLLNSLNSKLPTQVHVITDFGWRKMKEETSFFSYAYPSNVIFRIFDVNPSLVNPDYFAKRIKSLTYTADHEPLNKKQKTKNPLEVTVCIHECVVNSFDIFKGYI